MTKTKHKELFVNRETCISCAGCIGICPEMALDMHGLDLKIYPDKCTLCGLCLRICPVGALYIENFKL